MLDDLSQGHAAWTEGVARGLFEIRVKGRKCQCDR